MHRGSISEKIVLAQRFISGSRGVPMPTECSATLFEFARVEGRSVVGAFDGGKITSDAGALLLAATDRAVGLIDRAVSPTPIVGTGRAHGGNAGRPSRPDLSVAPHGGGGFTPLPSPSQQKEATRRRALDG